MMQTPIAIRELLAMSLAEQIGLVEAHRFVGRFALVNQALVARQCASRDLELGPIATYDEWKAHGRAVLRGERALAMVRVRGEAGEPAVDAKWFALSQTAGAATAPCSTPAWSESLALERLNIRRLGWNVAGKGVAGWSFKRFVAVNPTSGHPRRTLVHEVAHVLLEHTTEVTQRDAEDTNVTSDELEARAVAALVATALDFDDGAEHAEDLVARIRAGELSDEGASRVFTIADRILRAGERGPYEEAGNRMRRPRGGKPRPSRRAPERQLS